MQGSREIIEPAWENRASLSPSSADAQVREAVDATLAAPRRGRAAGRREDRRPVADPPVAQEGGAALVPSAGQPGDARGVHPVLRQGADEVRRLHRRGLRRRRLPRRAARGRAPRRFVAQQRGADALLREHRRLRRRGHDGGHLGDGRQLRADRQERAPLGRRRHRRRARAAAGQPDHHRGQLLHRRAVRGRRRA